MRDFRGKGSVTRHVVFFALLLFYFTSRSVFRKRLFTRLRVAHSRRCVLGRNQKPLLLL